MNGLVVLPLNDVESLFFTYCPGTPNWLLLAIGAMDRFYDY
jgi:hypothetical protein